MRNRSQAPTSSWMITRSYGLSYRNAQILWNRRHSSYIPLSHVICSSFGQMNYTNRQFRVGILFDVLFWYWSKLFSGALKAISNLIKSLGTHFYRSFQRAIGGWWHRHWKLRRSSVPDFSACKCGSWPLERLVVTTKNLSCPYRKFGLLKCEKTEF